MSQIAPENVVISHLVNQPVVVTLDTRDRSHYQHIAYKKAMSMLMIASSPFKKNIFL